VTDRQANQLEISALGHRAITSVLSLSVGEEGTSVGSVVGLQGWFHPETTFSRDSIGHDDKGVVGETYVRAYKTVSDV